LLAFPSSFASTRSVSSWPRHQACNGRSQRSCREPRYPAAIFTPAKNSGGIGRSSIHTIRISFSDSPVRTRRDQAAVNTSKHRPLGDHRGRDGKATPIGSGYQAGISADGARTPCRRQNGVQRNVAARAQHRVAVGTQRRSGTRYPTTTSDRCGT